MRAGPLSNSEVIKTLNEKFVNTWIMPRDLQELIEGSKGERVSLFATALKGSTNTFLAQVSVIPAETEETEVLS